MRMAHGLWHGAGALGVGAIAGIVVLVYLGGSGDGGPHSAYARGLRHHPVATTAVVTTGGVPDSVAYTLHCGDGEARIGDKYYVAVHPRRAGPGSQPGRQPAGQDDSYRPGSMTVVSATEAVYTDRAGHHVEFEVRPGATKFLHRCPK